MKKIASDFYGFMYSLVISNLTVVILLTIIVIMLGFVTKKMYSKPEVKNQVIETTKANDIICIDKTSKSKNSDVSNDCDDSRTFTVEYKIYEKAGIDGVIKFKTPHSEWEKCESYSRKVYSPVYSPRLIRHWSYKFNITLEKDEQYYLKLDYDPHGRSTSTLKIFVDNNEVDEVKFTDDYFESCANCTIINY